VDVQHHVSSSEAFVRRREHAGLQGVGGVEQTREIVKDVLGVGVGAETDDREPGRLRFGAHDGQVLADERVEQARLADVGCAGEGDVAAEGHADPLSAIRYQLSVIRWSAQS
jgi:hypothetical protein